MREDFGPNTAVRSLLTLLGLEAAAADPRDTATVRRIVAELDRLEPSRAAYVAAFAYVLARLARADLEVHAAEIEAMEQQVARASDLAGPEAALVVEIAHHQATHQGGTEDYLVTRQFRELSERPQRVELVRALFAVAASDGSISTLEDQTISQIASELGLTAGEVAACRGAFRDRLAVLRDLPRTGPDPDEGPGG